MTDRDRQFDELYATHERGVRLLLVRLAGPYLDVDDLINETFVIAWRKLESMREAPSRAWLSAIAARVVANARRRARLRRFVGLDAIGPVAGEGTPATEFERAEASERVYGALEHLSEKKRTVFVLHELQGLTGEEIAAVMGCPLKTVWSRLQKARSDFVLHVRRLSREPALALEEGGAP